MGRRLQRGRDAVVGERDGPEDFVDGVRLEAGVLAGLARRMLQARLLKWEREREGGPGPNGGDPDDCARVIRMYEDIGIDQIILSPLTTTLPYDTALASLELFGKEVVPNFDTDPVHRTTRMRERAAGHGA